MHLLGGGGKWNRRFFSVKGTDLIYQADEMAPIKGTVDLKVKRRGRVSAHKERGLSIKRQ
jgi:hypothetical protein